MESFFHSLKADVVHGRQFQTVQELRQLLRRYLRYYTTSDYTRHSGIDHPLTTNGELRRNHPSTEPREDPGARDHERRGSARTLDGTDTS